jgi:cell division protein FtsN
MTSDRRLFPLLALPVVISAIAGAIAVTGASGAGRHAIAAGVCVVFVGCAVAATTNRSREISPRGPAASGPPPPRERTLRRPHARTAGQKARAAESPEDEPVTRRSQDVDAGG